METSVDKVKDILAFGAKEAIVVDDLTKLKRRKGKLDYMIAIIPAQYDVAAYSPVVKCCGFYTQMGMPVGFNLTLSNIGLANNRINFNAFLIGGITETQEVVNYLRIIISTADIGDQG
jgi:alcohol dehydrogenase (NADP+)/uncharacterized zinc-type alcohol dehydrogenase-like protein